MRGRYRHLRDRSGDEDDVDAGFQGFGAARSDAQGLASFRTIRPAPYSGRTPHIHVKLRLSGGSELTSQLFVASKVGNQGDFPWRKLGDEGRRALAMRLVPARDAGLAWRVQQTLVVPA